MKSQFGLSLLACLVAQAGFADTISPSKANGDFLSGTGIPNGDFTVSTAATGESVALRVRSRDTGLPLAEVGNKYYVLPGFSTLSPTQPWWEFDYQFSPGAGKAVTTDTSYILSLKVDFDPTVGTTHFATVPPTAAGSDPDLLINPMDGSWNTNSVTYVNANSLNLGFAFWNTLGESPDTYNPSTPGEYEIDFSVSDLAGDVLASTQVFAEVGSVPAPPSIVLLGSGLICGGFTQVVRRFRRR